MSRFASALYRISPEQSPRIRYTSWSRWLEKPRVLWNTSVVHTGFVRFYISVSIKILNRYVFITILDLWPWEKLVSYVGRSKKKSKDRRNLLFTFFFIAMKKKTMLGYETRLWKCKFAYLNQEDLFVYLTKRRIKKLLLRIFITYTILFNFKNTKIM